MRATIDIDTGGTFTDVFVTRDGSIASAKARTTPTRLASGILEAITMAAESLGISVQELLTDAKIVRHATTIATNALIQRTGPKLGLIATEGFEDLIYIARGASWTDGKTLQEQRHVGRAPGSTWRTMRSSTAWSEPSRRGRSRISSVRASPRSPSSSPWSWTCAMGDRCTCTAPCHHACFWKVRPMSGRYVPSSVGSMPRPIAR